MSYLIRTMLNLKDIFRQLCDDAQLLSTFINNDMFDIQAKHELRLNQYTPLKPRELETITLLSHHLQDILPVTYDRVGIVHTIDKNMIPINISFLNSIHVLLRPEILNLTVEEQIANYFTFESFMDNAIRRNCQIDKVKNTKKTKSANRELIQKLLEGDITSILIQKIVNIMEVNLLIFDMETNEIHFYWACGLKYQFFNPIKPLWCMTLIDKVYEPLINDETDINVTNKTCLINNVLENLPHMQCFPPMKMNLFTNLILESMNISHDAYANTLIYQETLSDDYYEKVLDETLKTS